MIPNPSRSLSLALFLVLSALATTVRAGSAVTDVGPEDEPAVFTDTWLDDGDVLRQGKKVWGKTCKLCHGNTAYPGKAPKLGTKCYEPEFVYDRVTNGFQAMPPWRQHFDKYERMAVAAYIVSKRFPSTCERN
jgi:cytochrome c5